MPEYLGVKKCPARKHHISLNVLWCAESNGYTCNFFVVSNVILTVAGLSETKFSCVSIEYFVFCR